MSPAPAGRRVAVVIPALNEQGAIGEVVRGLPADLVDATIVVDNGSTDRTAEAAREAGAEVLQEPLRGYGHACMRGIRRALEQGATVIVFVDGDYSDYPEDLPEVAGPVLRGDADLVIGSRMTGAREPGALLPQAVIGNRLAGMLIRLFWGVRFTDLGPFRAVSAEALRTLLPLHPTFGWTVDMQIRAARLGLRCAEVPVRYRKRIGTSKVTGTVQGTLKASAVILSMIALHALRLR
jgi:hypothetical protein